MAWTRTIVHKDAFGSKRVHVLELTADSAEATLDSGLGFIDWISVGIQSCGTAAIKIAPNSGSTGTAIAGYLGISGAASGDVFYVTCFGK